jgi:hypothetical protein
MKKIYFLLFAILISGASFGQLLLDENFDYGTTAGDLTTVTGNWTGFSGAAPLVGYATTSLSMATYPSSGIGGSATVSGASEDAQRLFSSVISGTVYASALVNISSVSTSGTYFYSLRGSGAYYLRLYADDDGSGNILFGLREGSDGSIVYGTNPYNLNTTYLIVLKYDFTAGASTLYVLPSVLATEGSATAEVTTADSTDPSEINGVSFRQASGSPTATIDGIRVGITWDDIMTVSTDPLIEVGSAVSGLDYEFGNGPSGEGSFTVQGSNLTEGILVTAPADFEVSETSGGTFTPTVTISDGGTGTVSQTTIYTRLKAGLAIAIAPSYTGDVSVTSAGAVAQTVSLEGSVYPTLTNAMEITGIFDPLAATPKGLEIHVISAIADLSIFGVGVANNGNGGGIQEFSFPAVAASAGDYLYIVNSGDTASFNSFFANSIVPYEDGDINFNGDDAVELFENGQIIDVFGDVNTDGSGEAWEYTDGWAYRNTAGPSTSFVSSEWDYSGTGNLDGATNSVSTSPFPSTAILSIKNFSKSELSIYPNPTSLGYVNISSKSQTALKINVFDVLGKQVISKTVNNNRLDVSTLTSGIYIMKISQDDATTTKKLVIK